MSRQDHVFELRPSTGRLHLQPQSIQAGVNLDAPPYFIFSEFDIEAKGLNLVGMRRAGLVLRYV